MNYDFSLNAFPAFLSYHTLQNIRAIAAEISLSRPDFDLTQKLTSVQGYAELINEDPKNLAYHISLRRATARMAEAMRRKKYESTELVDRLEELLS